MPLPLTRRCFVGLLPCLVMPAAFAHGTRAGVLRIEHPYALPSDGDVAWVYLRAIDNRGNQADRLLGARTVAAQRVQLVRHGGTADEQVVTDLELPPRTRLSLGHRDAHALRLRGLAKPLRDGDRFELTLRFAVAGDVPVQVWVQSPRDRWRRSVGGA